MKRYLPHIVYLMMATTLGWSCSKQQDDLVLNDGYHQVADVLEYCQGSCQELFDWEGFEVLVKGYNTDAGNDAAMLDHFNNGRFYLHDIRNGMFMEVRVTHDKEAIFQVLNSLNKTDEVFLAGTTESVIVNEGNECMKGVVIFINNAQSVKINL